jgi:hypothetical protein
MFHIQMEMQYYESNYEYHNKISKHIRNLFYRLHLNYYIHCNLKFINYQYLFYPKLENKEAIYYFRNILIFNMCNLTLSRN